MDKTVHLEKSQRVAIIGSGFAGLSSAAYMAAAGHMVDVYEKNDAAGGRARQLVTKNGYTFDMGPSWYWMPDVFDDFFNDFNLSVSDFYTLKKLDPSFEIVFKGGRSLQVPSHLPDLYQLFESLEPGSAIRLCMFLTDAKIKYELGMKQLAYLPGLSIREFASSELIGTAISLNLVSSLSKHVVKYFKHPYLVELMEFPVLFLGAMPRETPALYSLMNYAGLALGTWYPMGGFGCVVESLRKLAEQYGARFHFNSSVDKLSVNNVNKVDSILVNGDRIGCDAVIATADYHHVEQSLLPAGWGNYEGKYWMDRTLAPSCLIYFIGVKHKLNSLQHHTLFFDEDLGLHANEIYKDKRWPTKPLFYVCCPSRTDLSVAPDGHENLFLLMPLAAGLEDTEPQREKYFQIMIRRLQKYIGVDFTEAIDFKHSYCINDFVSDYNSFRGNGYGLANTLRQTALLKPKMRNKKISNLFYAGQMTVPGPGVPPALISGKLAATQLIRYFKTNRHEMVV